MDAWRAELYHHGILGMRWGIRRFQKYPKGHKGGKEVGEAAKQAQQAQEQRPKSETSSYRKSDVATLTDQELKARISRLSMEEVYNKHLDRIAKENRTKAQVFLQDYVKPAADDLAKKYTKDVMQAVADPIVGKLKDGIKSAQKKNSSESESASDKTSKKEKKSKKQEEDTGNNETQKNKQGDSESTVNFNFNFNGNDKHPGGGYEAKKWVTKKEPVEEPSTKKESEPKNSKPEVLNSPERAEYDNVSYIKKTSEPKTLDYGSRYDDIIKSDRDMTAAREFAAANSTKEANQVHSSAGEDFVRQMWRRG